jgi:hypothetical protein
MMNMRRMYIKHTYTTVLPNSILLLLTISSWCTFKGIAELSLFLANHSTSLSVTQNLMDLNCFADFFEDHANQRGMQKQPKNYKTRIRLLLFCLYRGATSIGFVVVVMLFLLGRI